MGHSVAQQPIPQIRSKASGQEPDNDTSSARRLLRVLLSFSANKPHTTAEDLARRIGLPLSSTYRYLATLRDVGLVEDHGRAGFAVGPAALRLAQAARVANPLERFVRPHASRLSKELGETVGAMRRVNDKAICIEGCEPARMIRSRIRVGAFLPLHVGAAPFILLAAMPEPARDQMIRHCAARHGLDATCVDAIRTKAQEVAARGWTMCYGGADPDAFAVAAPIRDSDGVIASLLVVGPTFRISPAESIQFRDRVMATAAEISAQISDQTADQPPRGNTARSA